MTELVLVLLLLAKHLIVDFPLQTPYQWMNKGVYGHPGGIVHAALHTIGSLVVLWPAVILMGLNLYAVNAFSALFWLCVVEGIIHYHVDYAKMNLNAKHGWKCNEHAEFWSLLGLDQFLHQLTYLAMVAYLCQGR